MIVSGGLGMIGSLVGCWLVKQQVAHIVLLGRSGRPSGELGTMGQLVHGSGTAAAVHMSRCDTASTDEVAAAAAATSSSALQGTVHSGGVLADAAIHNQTLAGIRATYAPKATSAQLWKLPANLHASSMHLAFSSVAALLGSPGQANYSMANAVLDAMAHEWRAQVGGGCAGSKSGIFAACRLTPLSVHITQGLVGLSVQWGAWAEGGMAAANAATAKAVERMGMRMIAPEQGVGAIEALMLSRGMAALPAVTAAVPFCWGRFIQRLAAGTTASMFAAFEGEAAAEIANEQSAAPGLLARRASIVPAMEATNLRTAVPGRRRVRAAKRAALGTVAGADPGKEFMVAQVQEAVASVLGSAVGLDDPLMAAGLDSLGSGGLVACAAVLHSASRPCACARAVWPPPIAPARSRAAQCAGEAGRN